MTKESEEKLISLLKEWFGIVDFNKPHFFKRNKVAALLRGELNFRNVWKRKTRADARHLRQWRFGR